MKVFKKIVGTVVFWGIGILLFCGVSYIMRPVYGDFFRDKFVGFYAEEEDSLDIVTLGSSALYRYFNNPYLWNEFGMTSYNLSTAGQSVFVLEDLLDEVLKTQSPELIIVEARKFILEKEKGEYSKRYPLVHDNMNYSWNRIELINRLLDTWQERINAYFDIIVYHNNWENLTLDNFRYIVNKKEDSLKGWRNIKTIKNIKEPVIDSGEEMLPISEDAEQALIQFMEKCKKENIPVLFVATPWRIKKENQKKNRYFEALVEEYDFPFLDCNQYIEEIGLDFSKDFYNFNHTNMLGAEKVTKFIGNYIQENYQFSVSHSEEVIESWNKAASKNQMNADAYRIEMLGSTE